MAELVKKESNDDGLVVLPDMQLETQEEVMLWQKAFMGCPTTHLDRLAFADSAVLAFRERTYWYYEGPPDDSSQQSGC